MDRKSKILLTSMLILILMSVAATYYRYGINRDFEVTEVTVAQ